MDRYLLADTYLPVHVCVRFSLPSSGESRYTGRDGLEPIGDDR